jgi:5-methylcytosine-specific restriction endonuclease McrA
MTETCQQRAARLFRRRLRLFKAQDGKCFHCDCECTMEMLCTDGKHHKPYPNTFTIDHVYPRTDPRRLDPTALANVMGMHVVGACSSCNHQRGSMPFEEFFMMKRQVHT